MTPITEEYLLAHGWTCDKRGGGYAFFSYPWTEFQTIKLSLDERRLQWRIHWNYNDTDIAFLEDIDTMTTLWQHSGTGLRSLSNLKK